VHAVPGTGTACTLTDAAPQPAGEISGLTSSNHEERPADELVPPARAWSAVAAVEPPHEPVARRVAKAGPALTGRELDAMRLVADGETNRAIGRRLTLSEGTVKTHVSNILHKLDASNRAQAVALWCSG